MAVQAPSWEAWQANMTHIPSGSVPSSRDRRDYYDNFVNEINNASSDAYARQVIAEHSLDVPSGGSSGGGSKPSSSSSGGGGSSAPSTPSDYGLSGKVNAVDTSKFELKDWANVENPFDPMFLDKYKEWADSEFIGRQVQREDTVKGQLADLLAEGSPYLDQARKGAERQAASRGLLNSSIAAGQGEAAAIQNAMPIAQQDASTYFSQGINNQNLQNQFALARQNAGMSGMMEMDKLKQTLDADFAKFNAEMDLKVESFNSTMGFEAAMKAQELAQAQILARAQAWNALDTANISASASLGVANIHAEASKDVAYKEGLMNIWNNPNISPQQSEVFTDRWQQVNGHATSSIAQWDQAYA